MRTATSALLLFALLASPAAAEAQESKRINDSIDIFIKKKMDETGIAGMSAAIIINKELAWIKGYGYSDKENQIPFTPNTVMNIASITKTVTGVCLMQAVEEKKLSLDEDINTYLPFRVVNPFYPDEKITLRNIATHTSGLADRSPFYDSTYTYGSDATETLGDFLKNYFVKGGRYYTQENFLKYKPGTYREYSNIAAGLAGYIVELKTGKKLDQYSGQHIFDPLGMTNTSWFISATDLSYHSKLYEKRGDTLATIPIYGNITYPDGGVRTSVSQLVKFFISLLNEGEYNGHRILKKESATEMLKFQFTENDRPVNVDLKKLNSGIFWATKLGATAIGHNGSDPGVRTFMLADTGKKIGVIFFANTSLPEKQEGEFFDIYNGLYDFGKSLEKGMNHDQTKPSSR